MMCVSFEPIVCRMKMILLVTAAVSKRAASYTNCIIRPSAVGGGIHYSNSFQLRTLNSSHHRFATTSDEQDDDDDEERRKKVLSRKQRRRQTEELNLQRIDKLLAHRGVGTRSETFELAKARRVAYATHPNASHEERTRIRGPKEKVPYDASLYSSMGHYFLVHHHYYLCIINPNMYYQQWRMISSIKINVDVI